jgi:hypothetical protein
MSGDVRRLATDEQRDRLFKARHRGGLCAGCGRALAESEPVYLERFVFRQVGPSRLTIQAPVCRDCASPDTLARMVGREPERCAGCGRAVFYPKVRGDRQRALCSRDCRNRAAAAARRAAREEADR